MNTMNTKILKVTVAAIIAGALLYAVNYFLGFETALFTGLVCLIALKAGE